MDTCPFCRQKWDGPRGLPIDRRLVNFFAKVDATPGYGPNGDCWKWCGSTSKRDGYGNFGWGPAVSIRAHRASYMLFVGPIPQGFVIDHLCRVRDCVNPKHLEAVTDAQNILRGLSHAAENARRTHCGKGHEFTTQTVMFRGLERQVRVCLECRNERAKLWERQYPDRARANRKTWYEKNKMRLIALKKARREKAKKDRQAGSQEAPS